MNKETRAKESESTLAKKLRHFIERHERAKFVLFVMVMLGTGLVIGDGILTPAISGGLQNLFSCFEAPLRNHLGVN